MDAMARAEQELERAGDDPVAFAPAQAQRLRAIVEELRELNAQVEDLHRWQKQTRDRTF